MILHITDENHFVGVLGPVRGSETIGLAKNAHCLSGLTPSITVTHIKTKTKTKTKTRSLQPPFKMFSNLTASSGSATCEPLEKQPQRWDQEVFWRRHHRRGSLVPLLQKHHCGNHLQLDHPQTVIGTMKEQLARPNYRTIRMIVNAMRSLDHFSKRVYHF